MGKLFIGDLEPTSLGAIDKLYVGNELIWPSVQPPGWQNGATLTNLVYGGSNGALVGIAPAPTGQMSISSIAPVTSGEDTLNGFEYFTPVATDVTLGRFFRVVNDASPGFPGAWTAINSFYFPHPFQMSVTDQTPTAFQSGRFEFSETNGGPIVATVGYNINLTYVPATSGFIAMNNARVESRSGSANNLSSRITWNADGTATPSVTGGTMSAFGVRDWWFGTPLPPTLWFRWRNVGQNGGTVNVARNSNGVTITENTWINFNPVAGFFAQVSSSGSSAYNRWVDIEVDFSTQGGGGAVASTSSFRLQVIKT